MRKGLVLVTKVFCQNCKHCKWIPDEWHDLHPMCIIRFSDLMAFYKLSRSEMIDKLAPTMVHCGGVTCAFLYRSDIVKVKIVNAAETIHNCFNSTSYRDNSNSNPYIVFNADFINYFNDCKYYSPSLLYKVKHLFSNRKD